MNLLDTEIKIKGDNNMELNKNYEFRDEIIFGRKLGKEDYLGGCKRFERIDYHQLAMLIALDYIDLEECQNESPTTREIFNFMMKYPNVLAHGYVISPERIDYRITLEGVDGSKENKTTQFIRDFSELFHNADEFDIDTGYCWYD
jgi:hypothetical protein